MPNRDFFTSRGVYVNLRYIAMLYTYSIGNQPWNTMVIFKMRDSVPSARYSSICNVLRLWRISLIPTFVIVDTAVRVRYAGCLIDIVLYSF